MHVSNLIDNLVDLNRSNYLFEFKLICWLIYFYPRHVDSIVRNNFLLIFVVICAFFGVISFILFYNEMV